jgi:3-hydroxyacyl-CoA dehydrogenase
VWLSATASVTGLTTEDVLTALQSGQTFAQIAEANDQPADEVIDAARALLQEQLDQAVTEGRITQEQADAKLANFDANASTIVNSTMVGKGGHGPGDGRFGRGGVDTLLSATATVTGLTTDEVITARQSGQSLAQIVEANGQTVDDVIAAARTQLEDLLQQAVTDGRITQEQADAKLANFDATAVERMSSTYTGHPHGRHGQGPWDGNNLPEATPAPSNTSLDA